MRLGNKIKDYIGVDIPHYVSEEVHKQTTHQTWYQVYTSIWLIMTRQSYHQICIRIENQIMNQL